MSQLQLCGNPTGTGTVTIQSPNTNSNRTLTLPDHAGSVAVYGDIIDLGDVNGYGSTATCIHRWSTVYQQVDNGAMTLVQSAANGDHILINKAGLYMVHFHCNYNSGQNTGISVNSNQLTTQIGAITAAHRRMEITTSGASVRGQLSGPLLLQAGDIVRAHANSAVAVASAVNSRFTIARVG